MKGSMRALGIAAALVLASYASPAAAQKTKQECVAAAETAQSRTLEGKLTLARVSLLACANEACPTAVRSYCLRWLEEANASIPTVVLRVRDDAGRDLPQAAVSIDGKSVERWSDGLPLQLDPGKHVLQITNLGSAPVVQPVLLATGEKNRLLSIVVPRPAPPPPPPSTVVLPVATPRDPGATRRTVGYVVGATGLVAAGVGAFFGVRAIGKWNDSDRACPGDVCTASGVQFAKDARTNATLADIAVGVAAVGIVTGAYLILSAPKATTATAGPSGATVAITPDASTRSAGVLVVGTF